MIDAFISVMNSEDSFVGPLNLGNNVELKIKELVEKVIKMTSSNSELIYQPLSSDDSIQRKPNIALGNEKLNWNPKIQLEEGLSKTIPLFQSVIFK
jgi:UDP-glucuronate decarboxylase